MSETEKSKRRLLEFAVERLGRREVAARLRVNEATLDGWLQHPADITNTKSLALADLVSDLNRQK